MKGFFSNPDIILLLYFFLLERKGIKMLKEDMEIEEYRCPKCGSNIAYFNTIDGNEVIICKLCRFSEKVDKYEERKK